MDSIKVSRVEGKVTSGVGVVDKTVLILSFLAEGGPAALAGVVEGTGLSRPTVYRLLSALEAHRLVTRGGGRYALGVRLASWGSRVVGVGLVERARPVLVALRDETGESIQLYVRERDRRLCVASVERAGGGLRDAVPVGAVLALARGSGGKVLLAWGGEEHLSGADAAELAEIRNRGWAESVAEREAGVASVSAPVFGPEGELKAAVCASGPISRLGEHPGERLAGPVVAASRRISHALG